AMPGQDHLAEQAAYLIAAAIVAAPDDIALVDLKGLRLAQEMIEQIARLRAHERIINDGLGLARGASLPEHCFAAVVIHLHNLSIRPLQISRMPSIVGHTTGVR